jgi:hypothetical protein
MRKKAGLRSIFALILLTILGIFLAQSRPAQAAVVKSSPQLASELATYFCGLIGGAKGQNFCLKYGISGWFDPPSGSDISSIQLQFDYDPAQWVFDAAASGLVCALASGGDCPAPAAALGTFPIAEAASSPGSPLPGSTLTMTAAGGVVTVDYTLPSPVDLSVDQNVFVLSFDFIDPVDLDAPMTQPLITACLGATSSTTPVSLATADEFPVEATRRLTASTLV